jgi:hypothetical protein
MEVLLLLLLLLSDQFFLRFVEIVWLWEAEEAEEVDGAACGSVRTRTKPEAFQIPRPKLHWWIVC